MSPWGAVCRCVCRHEELFVGVCRHGELFVGMCRHGEMFVGVCVFMESSS